MKIEAVVVCVNYADFLAHTILFNKPLFDRLVVVTTPEDRRTRDLAEFHHVECVTTSGFYANEQAFNKGAGINAGLDVLSGEDWICHLDADIALPPRTRPLLEHADLNPDGIYGIDRLMCASFEQWSGYVSQPEVQHSCDAFVTANAFPLGTRVADLNLNGYVPIGFFQLWNAGRTGVKDYPGHGDAGRGVMSHAKRWGRRDRHLLPEVVGIHIASEAEETMGSNWRGRQTPHFGPKTSPAPGRR